MGEPEITSALAEGPSCRIMAARAAWHSTNMMFESASPSVAFGVMTVA
jgi:hypothetical protein